MKETRKNICPVCGQEYGAPPAISRKDGKTAICPECGALEAMQAAGFDNETIQEVLQRIRKGGIVND